MALDAQWSAVARGYRLALVAAGLVGFVAIAVSAVTGYPFAGFFITRSLLGSGNDESKPNPGDTVSTRRVRP